MWLGYYALEFSSDTEDGQNANQSPLGEQRPISTEQNQAPTAGEPIDQQISSDNTCHSTYVAGMLQNCVAF